MARLAVTSRPSGVHCWLDVADGVSCSEVEQWFAKWLTEFKWEDDIPLRYAVFYLGHNADMEWPHEPTAEERLNGLPIGSAGEPVSGDWAVTAFTLGAGGTPPQWPAISPEKLIAGARAYLES